MSQNELHVIFGTGALGKWTARELVRLGKNVRMVSHSGKADSRIPAKVEVVKGDAHDTKHNIEVTKDVDAVYQCAQLQYHEWVEKFPPMQKAILDAASTNGAKFIVADNLYMYGDTHGQPIREDSHISRIQKRERCVLRWQPLSWMRIAQAKSALRLGAPPTFSALMITR